ncbi:hypothetical protein ABPG74_003477 [Tetrahymena malaccensis]
MRPWAFIVTTLIFCCSVHAANRYWIDIPDSFQKNMMALDTNQSGSYIEPWHPRMKFEMKIQIPHFKRNLRKQQLTLASSFLQMSQSDYFMDKNLFCSCKFIIPEKPSTQDDSIETAGGQKIEQQSQQTQQETEQQVQQQSQQQVTQQQTSVDQSGLSIENMTPEQLQMLQQSIIRKKQQGTVKNSQIFIQQNQQQQQQYQNQEYVQPQTYQQPVQQQIYSQPQQQQQLQTEQPNAQVLIGILEQQKQVIDLIENMYVHPQLQQQQAPVYSHTAQQQGQYVQENQQIQYQQPKVQQQYYQMPQQQQQQVVTNQQQQMQFIQQQPQVVQQQPIQQQPIQQQQQAQVLLQKPVQQQQQPQYQQQQQVFQQEQIQQQQQQQQNNSYFSPAYAQLSNINSIPNVSQQQSYQEQPQVQSYQFDPKIFQQQKEVYGLNY